VINRHLRSIFWLAIWLVSFFCAGSGLCQGRPVVSRVSENGMRSFVVKSVMPSYPPADIKNGTSGVAVAHIEVDETGEKSKVTVVEAPSATISAEVLRAVSLWQFAKTRTGGRPTILVGNLTFYFLAGGGNGRVLNPAEAGYVGRWPEKVPATTASPKS